MDRQAITLLKEITLAGSRGHWRRHDEEVDMGQTSPPNHDCTCSVEAAMGRQKCASKYISTTLHQILTTVILQHQPPTRVYVQPVVVKEYYPPPPYEEYPYARPHKRLILQVSPRFSATLGRVTVEQSPGRSIPLCIGMRFAIRQDATLHIKNFSLVQGKQAVLNLKPSGGTANVYVCSSKTKCSFEVRVLRSKSTLASDFFVSSFNAEHNVCTGFAKAALSRSLG
ncbi:hypothetical protein JG687_00009940 [Phytophthora cactorum]|uniref:Uncharacterized protein n=1 Tax=Phytophthora cactorum TaxID=29920 RepID=A0A8T1UCI4_9STRA|nr:hypothetical protein JG687_00009940 [Phytophthora cactorum]